MGHRAVSGIELDNLEAMWSYIENITASEKKSRRGCKKNKQYQPRRVKKSWIVVEARFHRKSKQDKVYFF